MRVHPCYAPDGHGKYASLGALTIAAVLAGTGIATGYHSILVFQDVLLGADVATEAPGNRSSAPTHTKQNNTYK